MGFQPQFFLFRRFLGIWGLCHEILSAPMAFHSFWDLVCDRSADQIFYSFNWGGIWDRSGRSTLWRGIFRWENISDGLQLLGIAAGTPVATPEAGFHDKSLAIQFATMLYKNESMMIDDWNCPFFQALFAVTLDSCACNGTVRSTRWPQQTCCTAAECQVSLRVRTDPSRGKTTVPEIDLSRVS